MNKRLITIEGYEGLYYIYENGDCYSIRKQRYLKPFFNNCNYVQYFLTPNNGKGRWFKAHRLVLITFKGYHQDVKCKEVNHIDHNRFNNNLSNLEWVTHSANILKSFNNEYQERSSHWKGKTKAPHSLLTKEKMSNAKLKPVRAISKNTGEILTFDSVNDLCNTLGIYRKKFNRCINKTCIHPAFDFEFIKDVS